MSYLKLKFFCIILTANLIKDYPSSSTHLKSDSVIIVKPYQSVTETREKGLGKNSPNDVIFDIPMTLSDYHAVLFFGRKKR